MIKRWKAKGKRTKAKGERPKAEGLEIRTTRGEKAMMKFEDLEVWKRSARLSADLYKQLSDLNDYGFRDQITRSGLSVPSNIAEGFERESQRDCIKFLTYAKGSCGELRCQIYIGMEVGYIPKDAGKKWIQETIEISSMLSGLIKTKRGFLKSTLAFLVSFVL